MAAITIDETTRFVCVQSFTLKSDDMPAMTRKIKHAVEERSTQRKGLVGSIVMANDKERRLSVISAWESAHEWSGAEYDRDIGQAVSDVVEAATSYDIETYETVTIVRA